MSKKALDTITEEAQLMGLFEKLPDHCLTCLKPYDSKDREMVTTWSVVVRNKAQKVNLYCPECWSMAKSAIKDFLEKNKPH